jgi:uncharacterized protein
MIPALARVRTDIDAACRRHHVRRLDLFGSATRETDFTELSDIDLLVEYEPQHSPPTLASYLAFRDDLSDLLGRMVDLVMEGAVRNPYLRAAIERSRQPLHGT